MRLLLTYILLATPLIGLSQPPSAQFVSDTNVVCVGETVNFTDLSTTGASSISTWVWDFGDGNSSNSVNPSHIYNSAGMYTVILVVTAANGQADSEVKFAYIKVDPLPTVSFSSSTNGCTLPVSVTFTNLTGSGISYEWDFGNGQTSSDESPSAVIYNTSATYTVTLTATNSFGCTNTISQGIVISDFQAGILAPATVCVGVPVSVSDNSSVGVNAWNWTFIGGSPSGLNNQTEDVLYSSPGVYNIQLTAQNTTAGCSDNSSKTITVLPLPTPSFNATPISGCSPQTVAFINTTGSLGDFVWDFGDGTLFSGITPPDHIYATDGSYTVGLTFTDTNGCSGSIIENNYINLTSPIASFGAPITSGCEPLAVQLLSTSQSLVDPIVDWLWDFGDGTIFNGEVPPSHDYSVGNYSVKLTITTQGGCSDTLTIPDYIKVGHIDLVDFSWNPPISCVNVPVDFLNASVISAPHDSSEVSYFWDFGDGGTSTLENPSYSYSADTGYFDVQLVVNFRGCRDTILKPDAVYILAPISVFQPSQTLFCNPASFPITVSVNDNSIIGLMPDDADMIWNWGDGTITNFDDPDFDDPDKGSTSHDYNTYGSYTITQTIHNYTTGCVDSSSILLDISQTIAALTVDLDSVCLGSPITLTSTSTSTHSFGSFSWDMGDGQLITGEVVPYIYSSAGSYSINLTATNSLGCSDTQLYSPETVLSLPVAAITANDVLGCIPLSVTFSNNSISQGNGVPLDNFLFSFSDDLSTVSTNDLTSTVSHIFNSVGDFWVSLIATDQYGCVSPPAALSISITKPIANFHVPNVVCNNQGFTAQNQSTGVEPMTYQWFVDGTPVSSNIDYYKSFNEPNNPASSNTPHDITLITTDANGCRDTLTQTVVVSTPSAKLTYTLGGAATNAAGDFICPPVFADFTDHSISYGIITSWAWNFGDGKTSFSQSPDNTYVFPGTYTASMSITNEYGCRSDTTLVDFLTIFGPSANPTWMSSLNSCGLTVNFDIGATQNVTGILWDLNDGTTVTDQNNTIHLYNQLGTYSPTVAIHDANNCQVNYLLGPFTLNHPLLGITSHGDSIQCFGDGNGNITGVVRGGTAPYSLVLNQTGETQVVTYDGGTFDFSGLNGVPGGGFNNYTVTVSDALGSACTVTSEAVQIIEPAAPVNVLLDSLQNILCFGNPTGTISVSISGGTSPYSCAWSGPNGFTSNLEDLTGLIAGTYTLSVTDAYGNTGGCADVLIVTLQQPASGLALTMDSLANELCYGQNLGSIFVSTTGGVSPYEYLWTGPNGFTSANEDLMGLSAGTYNLSVSDASGASCNASISATVTEPPLLSVVSHTTTNYNGFEVSCFGFSDGAMTATPFGGTPIYTYSWTVDPSTPTSDIPLGQSSAQSPSGITAGNYLLTVTDINGCSVTDQVNISQPTQLIIDTIVLSVYANGFNLSGCSPDGTAEAIVFGGIPSYVYDWSNDGSGDFNDSNAITNLEAGMFNIAVKDLNGCIANGLATLLSQDTVLTLSSVLSTYPSGDNISCFGFNDGQIDLTVIGGTLPYVYSWTSDPSSPAASVPIAQNSNQDLTAISAGTYHVTVTEATGCTVTLSITLIEPAVLNQTGSSYLYPSLYNIRCFGDSNGSILNYTVNGGSPPYVYDWVADSSTPGAVIPVGQQDLTSPSGLTAGTYHVSVNDLNNCIIDTSITLIEPPLFVLDSIVSPVFNSGHNISCHGEHDGSIFLGSTGGVMPYVYEWQSPVLNSNWTPFSQNQVNIMAGSYSVVIKDAAGCHLDTMIILTEPPMLVQYGNAFTYESGDNIRCHGDSNGFIVDYIVTGGSPNYTYNWSIDPSTPLALIPTGQETMSNPQGLTAGTFTVIATDINGCKIDTTISLTEPPELSLSVIIQEFNGHNVAECADNGAINLIISGGSPIYTILWSNGATTEDIDSLPAGQISAVITDLNGCQITLDTMLSQSPQIEAVAFVASDYNGQDISCYHASDAVVNVLVNGGAPSFLYSWTDSLGNVIGSNSSVPNLGPGVYQVVVEDHYHCLDTSYVIVTEPTVLMSQIVSAMDYNGFDISCFEFSDGALDFTLNGGTPSYAFSWKDSTGNIVSQQEDPSGLFAGTYFVEAEDLNGCTLDTMITLFQPTPLAGNVFITSDYNGQNVSCYQASDGAVASTVSGGVPSYVCFWYDMNGDDIGLGTERTGISAGNYTWIASDLNGCTVSQAITLSEPQEITVTPQIVSYYFGAAVSCEYNSDGIVSASASGGVPGYTYAWNTTPIQIGSLASGLSAGTYSVTATDMNGCMGTNTITLLANPSPHPILPPPNYGCVGSNILIDIVQDDWQYCSWTFTDGQNFTGCNPFVTSFENIGCYGVQLTVLSAQGCMGSVSSADFVCIEPDPIASFYADDYQISNVEPGVAFINTSLGSNSYYWYYSDVSYYDSTVNVYHEFNNGDDFAMVDYTVTLFAVSKYGCIDSTSRVITMTPELIIYVPNAFTPDGDIYNNSFFPVINGGYITEDYSFMIFNRWGELIFESRELGEGWDGNYRDKKCQDDVYTWKLNVRKSYSHDLMEYVGHVTLLRGVKP